jgi:Tat protein secretion system quality control protein TatD with DNase activity
VREVVKKMAELRGVGEEAWKKQLEENVRGMFGV